jgi:alpha-glucosidase
MVLMKRRFIMPGWLIGLLYGLFFLSNSTVFAAKETILSSPDGSIQFKLFVEKSRLSFSVNLEGRPVIENSPLTILVDRVDITYDAKQGKLESYQLNETYSMRGVHSRAANHCNGMKIAYIHKKSSTRYMLDVRAYNDGIAFRFIVPGDSKQRTVDETSSFILPMGSTLWYHSLDGHYEGIYAEKEISQVQAGEWAAPPLTVRLSNFKGYISITEAALVNYSGMALKADGQRGFIIRLAHSHPISGSFKQHYSEEDGNRLFVPASISGTITTPWRAVMIGRDLNRLVNCDLVTNLCSRPDSTLFPQGMNTPWIKPGRTSWKSLDGTGDNSIKSLKEFIRQTGKLGLEYCVLESYWAKWSEKDLKDLIKFANQQHVGLWVWKNSKDLRDNKQRKDFFKRCRDLGIAGIKIDYFDNEAKEIINFYHILLKETAENKLMVDFHGANKPTGESRTWPNELTRAAIKGMDDIKLTNRATHDVILPFTRLVVGNADYEPMLFNEKRGNTTWAHQVASAAIFQSPLLTYSANPANILSNPCLDMIKSIPVVWDETVVLDDSEIGDLALFARRFGKTWFLAIMNGTKARTIKVLLSFLGSGDYKALLIGDNKKGSNEVKIENTTLRKSNLVEIDLSVGGGFIGRFSLK